MFAGGAKLGPKEQAYVAAVKQLNVAAAAKQPVDPVSTLGAACEKYEDKSKETPMSSCWRLLGDILAGAQSRRLNPVDQPQQYIEALIQVSSSLVLGSPTRTSAAFTAAGVSQSSPH